MVLTVSDMNSGKSSKFMKNLGKKTLNSGFPKNQVFIGSSSEAHFTAQVQAELNEEVEFQYWNTIDLYKNRTSRRRCRRKCKFYYVEDISRHNHHCCSHYSCCQFGGSCMIRNNSRPVFRKRDERVRLRSKMSVSEADADDITLKVKQRPSIQHNFTNIVWFSGFHTTITTQKVQEEANYKMPSSKRVRRTSFSCLQELLGAVESNQTLKNLQETPRIGVQKIFGIIMSELNFSTSMITLSRKHSFNPLNVPESDRYFKTQGNGCYFCPCKHSWQSFTAACFIDLKTRKICHRVKEVCENCGIPVIPRFSDKAISQMIGNAVSQFFDLKKKSEEVVENKLTDGTMTGDVPVSNEDIQPSKKRTKRRKKRKSKLSNGKMLNRSCTIQGEDNSGAVDIPVPSSLQSSRATNENEMVNCDVTMATRTTAASTTPHLGEASNLASIIEGNQARTIESNVEPSSETVTRIILEAMSAKELSPCDIPTENKFNLSIVNPYSLRYFTAQHLERLYCPHCKISYNSIVHCYIDLKMQGICHRFNKECKQCKQEINPQFSQETIENMAVTSINKHFIFAKKNKTSS